jgi:hypothetical protein
MSMAAQTTIPQFNLANGQRAERKLLITIAEWSEPTLDGGTAGTETVRELLGTRTEDSSIDYNADISQTTDIRGNNYADLEKTQPQQSFDGTPITGGARLMAYLNEIRRKNDISKLNNFTVYIVTAFVGSEAEGYAAEKHTGCSIIYDSIGGDTKVNFPYTVYFSNNITTGTIDTISPNFQFTPDVTV